MKLLDAKTLTEKATIDQSLGVSRMAFTHDSQQIVLAADDKSAQVVDRATGNSPRPIRGARRHGDVRGRVA